MAGPFEPSLARPVGVDIPHAVALELNAIAERELGRDLIDRRSDRLDFHEHHPLELMRALAAAYAAGRASVAKEGR